MPKYQVLLEKLVISPEKETTFISFVSEKDEKLGRLFIIGKLNSRAEWNQKDKDQAFKRVLDSLIDSIKTNYFNQTAPDVETALENTLQKVNQEWQSELTKNKEVLGEIDFKKGLKNLNLLIGAIKENLVYFSQTGKAHVFLIRGDKIVDILSSLEEERKINILKPFSNIISGQLKNKDVLFFCFDDLLDYLSTEKIKRILQEYSPSKACQYFKDLLQPIEIGNKKAFMALIFKISTKKTREAASPVIHVPITAKDSMTQLMLKQKRTERLLRPSIFPVSSTFFKNFQLKIKKLWETKKIDFIKRKKSRILFPFKKKLSKITPYIKSVFSKFPKIKFLKLKHPKLKKKQKFLKIPKQNKIYLIGSVVLAIILISTITFSIKRQANKKETKIYNNIVGEIQEKQNLISAALIYHNEERAKTLLQEIEKLLEGLPQNTSERQENYKAISQKNENQLNKIRQLFSIENPDILADFSSFKSDININNLLLFNNAVYSWQGSNLYKLDLNSRQISQESKLAENFGSLTHGEILNKDSLLFYTNSQKFVKFDIKKKSFSSFDVELKHQLDKIKDLSIYGTRLYILDRTNNQIYKYSKTSSGLGKETAWIKDGTDVKGIESIAIDSDVWGIKNNGEIIKMFIGKKESWSATIDPPLSSPTKIYTKLDYKYLYILDPGSRRLVIINKDGKIFKQFKSEKFDNLKDLTADEPAGKVYLLNGTNVYKINIKQ